MGLLADIKKLRIVTILSNIRYFYRLQQNTGLYKKYSISKKVWQPLSHKSIVAHGIEGPWLDQPVDHETIKKHPSYQGFSVTVQEQLLQWSERGFMIFPDFFPKAQIEQAEDSVVKSLSPKEQKKYASNRIINLYKTNELIESIFKNAELLKIISFVLGRDVVPYQTINFLKSASQVAHSDSVHLTTEPSGYLVGVWVALEDVKPGSGEFFYYPGSHKLDYIYNEHFQHKNNFWKLDRDIHGKYEKRIAEVIEESHFKKEEYLPKKGDIFIWHANLLHGSSPKLNPMATRKSLIMHYFAAGVLCYHELIEKPAILNTK